MSNLANFYINIGQFQEVQEAVESAQQALEIQRRTLGSTHRDTLRSMAALSRSYYSLGQDEKMLNITREELSLSEKMLGKDHPDH